MACDSENYMNSRVIGRERFGAGCNTYSPSSPTVPYGHYRAPRLPTLDEIEGRRDDPPYEGKFGLWEDDI